MYKNCLLLTLGFKGSKSEMYVFLCFNGIPRTQFDGQSRSSPLGVFEKSQHFSVQIYRPDGYYVVYFFIGNVKNSFPAGLITMPLDDLFMIYSMFIVCLTVGVNRHIKLQKALEGTATNEHRTRPGLPDSSSIMALTVTAMTRLSVRPAAMELLGETRLI